MTITIATVSQLATFDGSVQKPQTLKAAQEGNLLVQECCPFYQWGEGSPVWESNRQKTTDFHLYRVTPKIAFANYILYF